MPTLQRVPSFSAAPESILGAATSASGLLSADGSTVAHALNPTSTDDDLMSSSRTALPLPSSRPLLPCIDNDRPRERAEDERQRQENPESSRANIHPIYRAAGFIPGESEVPNKVTSTSAFHQTIHENIDNTLVVLAKTDDRVRALQHETADMAHFFNAQLDQFADELRTRGADALMRHDIAVIAERVSVHGDGTFLELIHASNKHSENFAASAAAIGDISTRVHALENTAASQINELATSVGLLKSTIDNMRATVEMLATHAASAPAPPATPMPPTVAAPPAALPPPIAPTLAAVDAKQTRIMFQQFLAASGKHVREEDLDDTIRNVRPRPGEAMQPTLIHPPPFMCTPTTTPFATPTGAPPVPIAPPRRSRRSAHCTFWSTPPSLVRK
ncbi:hypothetical protein C8J57DRAFT_1734101 [Mycena rebaudengoi]|nr:hypothetical protein C8J57DRAFT_1734101 [Mycena rebaudengoi]